MHCDYVVVGAGSAGCVLANRLSEANGCRVVVLERGADAASRFRIPARCRREFSRHVSYDLTTPQTQESGRPRRLTAGAVVGGGSTVNAMIYVRGSAEDYDGWKASGAEGWDFHAILPYFKRSEDQEHGSSHYHGVGGPLRVSDPRHISPESAAFVAACVESGVPRNLDFNAETQEGVGYFQLTQRNGERVSCADAFLRPALRRGNVSLVTGAQVARVVFRGIRAIGVEYIKDGKREHLDVDREVLLCAGALRSPQILMLSGIGPAEHLRSVGIATTVDLPGVGRNLQDHVGVPLAYVRKGERGNGTRATRTLSDWVRYGLARRGPWASNGIEAGAFVRVREQVTIPDVEYLIHSSEPDVIVVEVCLLDVRSRGKVRLRPSDPMGRPAISFNYMCSDVELPILVRGVEFGRALAHTKALSPFLGPESDPAAAGVSDRELRMYITMTAESCKHYAGTCRIGIDADAVVDDRLRVHGTEGLRVVDASVMRRLPCGHSNAATIMIAERGSDLVWGVRESAQAAVADMPAVSGRVVAPS